MGKRELAIVDDIPCPGQRSTRSEATETARRMKVGDSVFTTDHAEMESIRRMLYLLAGKAQTRKRVEVIDGQEVTGWRIWRSE